MRGTTIILGTWLLGGVAALYAQSAPATAGCTDAQKSDPKTAKACAVAPASAAASHPFQGDDADITSGPGALPAQPDAPLPAARGGTNAAAAHPYPGDPDESAAPDAPSAQPHPSSGSATAAHPYPGDPDAAKDSTSSSSSSSSSSGDSSSSPDDTDDGPLKDAGSSGDATKAVRGRRRKLAKVDPQTPAERESEDLDVSKFYLDTGDVKGAYARAQDAVSIMPDDPYAQLALAEAARRSGKPDEAREHYAKVLTLDPTDKQKREVKDALATMDGHKK